VTTPDINAVTAVLAEAAATLMLPRFRQLSDAGITRKSTRFDHEDIVTVVDLEVEAHVADALRALAPGTGIVAEEAAHRDPKLLHLLDSDEPVWLLDPLDGTRNFAQGDDRFGLMLSWVVAGHAHAAWIVLPARGELYVAETGGGAYCNGARVRALPANRRGGLRGALKVTYMPAETRDAVLNGSRARFVEVAASGCAAVDYTDIIRERREFMVYYRLLPWDHGAPALILTEAGGQVAHLDGSVYHVRSVHQVTVVARDATVSTEVRRWLR
jgi:fructose-1,6-bisphosphatase/inositol monophosphatase family enzyme